MMMLTRFQPRLLKRLRSSVRLFKRFESLLLSIVKV